MGFFCERNRHPQTLRLRCVFRLCLSVGMSVSGISSDTRLSTFPKAFFTQRYLSIPASRRYSQVCKNACDFCELTSAARQRINSCHVKDEEIVFEWNSSIELL